MDHKSIEQLKYPIGKFKAPALISTEDISVWIKELKTFPDRLKEAVRDLNDQQLDMPYRPGGWSLRQVVHHVADSHHNAYTRFKWALNEDQPVIKAYDENEWAEGIDYKAPVSLSLNYIAALHEKWTYLLENLKPTDLNRGYIHPAMGDQILLKNMVGMYAWHGDHHLAHITSLAVRESWN